MTARSDGPSFVQAVGIVARREVVERARDRGFLISTSLTVLVVLGVVLLPQLFGADDPETYDVGVVSTGEAAPSRAALEAQARLQDVRLRVRVVQEADAERLVADGDLDAENARLDGERILRDNAWRLYGFHG